MDALGELTGGQYAWLTQSLETMGLVFGALIIIELIYDAIVARQHRNFKQSWVDIGVYIGHELVGRVAGTLIFLWVFSFLKNLQLFRLEVSPLSWVAAIIVVDFFYYWSHRLEHRVRLGWVWHSVHHSSEEYNGTTALRLSWLEPLVSWYLLVPVVLLGFDPIQTLVVFQGLLLYQTWLHTKKIGKLKGFDRIFNSPSHHRAHHGSNESYIDKNYGAMLIIWDRIFGTFAEETDPVVYGLKQPIGTLNPFWVNFKEAAQIMKDVSRAKNMSHAAWSVLGPPEWNTKDQFCKVAPNSLWRKLGLDQISKDSSLVAKDE
jgi:sterol desaturase/sphingolipid hydroxylase (fatty acid hydroxylase superfamily)